MRTEIEIISDPNYLVRILFKRSYFSRNLEEEKVLELRQNFFFVFHKSLWYTKCSTLKLFWFTIDSYVLLNEGAQFFFHDICFFYFVLLIV